MSEWKEIEIQTGLSHIIDYRGKTPPKSDKGILLISAANVKNGELDFNKSSYINLDDYQHWTTRGFTQSGDVIITTEAPACEVALLPNDQTYQISRRVMALRTDEKLLHNKFLYFILLHPTVKAELLLASRGSTVPRVLKTDITKFKIRVPSYQEQVRLAAVISCIKDKIDLLYRQNKTLEATAQTLFRHWFIDEASDEWEEGCLGDIANNIRNNIKHDQVPTKTIYIGLEHIDKQKIALYQHGLSDTVTSNKYSFVEDDILFGKLRPYFHKVCFAPFNGICSTDILVLRPKHSRFFCFSLFAFFQSNVIEYANSGSSGTRMPRTSWKILNTYPILIPDNDALRRFNAIVEPSIDKIKQNLLQIRTLEQLRDTLLPKLMSGAVRVK